TPRAAAVTKPRAMSHRARPNQVPTSSPNAMVTSAAAKYPDGGIATASERSSAATTPRTRKTIEKVSAPSRDRSFGARGGGGGGGGNDGGCGGRLAYGPWGANGGR